MTSEADVEKIPLHACCPNLKPSPLSGRSQYMVVHHGRSDADLAVWVQTLSVLGWGHPPAVFDLKEESDHQRRAERLVALIESHCPDDPEACEPTIFLLNAPRADGDDGGAEAAMPMDAVRCIFRLRGSISVVGGYRLGPSIPRDQQEGDLRVMLVDEQSCFADLLVLDSVNAVHCAIVSGALPVGEQAFLRLPRGRLGNELCNQLLALGGNLVNTPMSVARVSIRRQMAGGVTRQDDGAVITMHDVWTRVADVDIPDELIFTAKGVDASLAIDMCFAMAHATGAAELGTPEKPTERGSRQLKRCIDTAELVSDRLISMFMSEAASNLCRQAALCLRGTCRTCVGRLSGATSSVGGTHALTPRLREFCYALSPTTRYGRLLAGLPRRTVPEGAAGSFDMAKLLSQPIAAIGAALRYEATGAGGHGGFLCDDMVAVWRSRVEHFRLTEPHALSLDNSATSMLFGYVEQAMDAAGEGRHPLAQVGVAAGFGPAVAKFARHVDDWTVLSHGELHKLVLGLLSEAEAIGQRFAE